MCKIEPTAQKIAVFTGIALVGVIGGLILDIILMG